MHHYFFWRLLTAVALLVAPLASIAQAVPPIVKSTSSNGISYFLFGSSACRKTQLLYPPATLAGPRVAGTIQRLYFMYADFGAGPTLTDLVITLGQTPNTTFVPAASFYANQDTVVNRASHVIPYGMQAGQWFSFDLDRAFTYDPAQTLIVGVTWATSSRSGFGTSGENTNAGTRGFGKKLYSDIPTATTGDTTSVIWQHFGFAQGPVGLPEVISADGELQVFPNSATNILTVVRPHASSEAVLTLTDALGRTIRKQKASVADLRLGITLDVHDLPAGPYVLSVRHCYQEFTRRVNVIHP